MKAIGLINPVTTAAGDTIPVAAGQFTFEID
jgi:hypothetical protein